MLGQVREAMACVVGGRAGRRGMKPTDGSLGGMVVATLERAPCSQVQGHGHEEK